MNDFMQTRRRKVDRIGAVGQFVLPIGLGLAAIGRLTGRAWMGGRVLMMCGAVLIGIGALLIAGAWLMRRRQAT